MNKIKWDGKIKFVKKNKKLGIWYQREGEQYAGNDGVVFENGSQYYNNNYVGTSKSNKDWFEFLKTTYIIKGDLN